MKTIYKYTLEYNTRQEIEMPDGATILSVSMQYDRIVVHARVDPEAPKVIRKFNIYGTGVNVPTTGHFVGTVLQYHGRFVWHVFSDYKG